MMNSLSPNSSIVAIGIAIIYSGSFWLFYSKKSKVQRAFWLFVSFATLFGILLLQSRTAFLAALIGSFYTLYPILQKRFSTKVIIFIASAVFSAIIIVLSLAIKTDSTAGRLFIWENSIQLFKQNWLTGVGIDKFNFHYNHLQSTYFSNHSLVSKEAILADDGYFAFNEWLHVGIELGIIGLFISVVVSYIILKACINNISTEKGWAGAALIAIFTACMFSYPLHNLIILGLTVFLSAYITNISKKVKIFFPKWFRIGLIMFLVCTLVIIGYRYFKNQQLFSQAKQSLREGYKTEAIYYSKQIAKDLKKDYSFTLFYLELLYETNRLQEAIEWFNRFHVYVVKSIWTFR